MKLTSVRASTWAGLAALLCGAAWLPFFYSQLFANRPSGMTPWQAAFAQASFDFSRDSPNVALMALWYAQPIAWLLVAAALLSTPRIGRRAALASVVAAGLLALTSTLMIGWESGFMFMAPVALGTIWLTRTGGVAHEV